MLGMFDEVGGSESEAERRPENARLVTPDVLLHAFHKYFENSLEYLERFDLAPLLRRFLSQPRPTPSNTGGRPAANWRRAMKWWRRN